MKDLIEDLISLPLEDRLYIIEQVLTSSNYADYLNYINKLLEKERISGGKEPDTLPMIQLDKLKVKKAAR